MWISIQTKRCQLSPRMWQSIDKYLRRALRREQRQVASIVLTIRPATLSREPGFGCRLRIWSLYLGTIVVNAIGPTVRTVTQQATARACHALRRRLQKRLSKLRRFRTNRLGHWHWDIATD